MPEIASRHHLELIDAVVDAGARPSRREPGRRRLVAATRGPGLIGALLVGLLARQGDRRRARPAVRGRRPSAGPRGGELPARRRRPRSSRPFVCLIASGGHTLLARVERHDGFDVLGRTLDDAAGEAFDKGARMLGLGYPGGAALERLAAGGDPKAFPFPGSPGERRRGAAVAGGLRRGARLLLRRASRRRCSTSCASSPSRSASERGRRPRGLLPGGDRRGLSVAHRTGPGARAGVERLAVGGGVAANGELRRRLAGARRRAARRRRAPSAPTTRP